MIGITSLKFSIGILTLYTLYISILCILWELSLAADIFKSRFLVAVYPKKIDSITFIINEIAYYTLGVMFHT